MKVDGKMLLWKHELGDKGGVSDHSFWQKSRVLVRPLQLHYSQLVP